MGFGASDLQRAERSVELAQAQVDRQRRILALLTYEGYSNVMAQELLAELERALAQTRLHRDLVGAAISRAPRRELWS